MTELDNILYGQYIIDGVQMPLSPARMLRECTLEPPLEPDGAPETVADEHLDPTPGSYEFREAEVERYAAAVAELKRSLPLPFAGPFTAGKVAQALVDAIWMSGHFRLGDLTLRADWKWNGKTIGNLAAFYSSVESACNYIDALGVKISRYSLVKGVPSVTFKASTIAEEDEVFGILLKVIVLTGLRKGEAIGLTWDCVDFRRGTIHINKQLQKRPKSAGGVVFASLKNGKGRMLKPAPYVMELLRHRLEQQIQHKENAQEAWAGWKTEAEHKKALVFTNLFGEPLHPQTVSIHFKKLAARIGAPNARVHDLRHTFAVLSIQNGDDYKTVQVNLGHATAAFTLDVYGHVSDAMKSASAARMEQYVRSSLNA